MSDLGMGWDEAPARYRAHSAVTSGTRKLSLQDIMLADAVALDRLIDFARRVRFVAHNSAAVRRLCDEILLRRPGTNTPGDGNDHGR